MELFFNKQKSDLFLKQKSLYNINMNFKKKKNIFPALIIKTKENHQNIHFK